MTTNTTPKAKTERLIVREIDGETLVYDRSRAAASCLNEFAARVWRECDGEITRRPSFGFARPPSKETALRRTTSVRCTPTATACHRTMFALICGSTLQPHAEAHRTPRFEIRSSGATLLQTRMTPAQIAEAQGLARDGS